MFYRNALYIYINTVEKSRTARSDEKDKNTNICPKTFNKTVTKITVKIRPAISLPQF